MNKAELVAEVAETTGYTKKVIDKTISHLVETIISAVAKDDKVTLVGFGSFESRGRKERNGRNPKSGESMTIPATKVPAFSAGKVFKDAVKEG